MKLKQENTEKLFQNWLKTMAINVSPHKNKCKMFREIQTIIDDQMSEYLRYKRVYTVDIQI